MSFFEEKKKRERKKKPIVLRVNFAEVEKEYGLSQSQIEKKSTVTAISSTNKDIFQQQTLSDKRKLKNIFILSMEMNLKPLLDKTNIWCFWCKHPFEHKPLGCPVKHYLNEQGESVYETYKIFCGFSCMKAHLTFVKKYGIDEHIYRESDTLMNQMYIDIYDEPPHRGEINASPDWQTLKVFGGQYEIEEFRKLNENVCISSTNIRMRIFPSMISSTDIFEKRCIF